MSMAQCLRDSIQLATAVCVKEQRSIVYLKLSSLAAMMVSAHRKICITTIGHSRLTIDIYE